MDNESTGSVDGEIKKYQDGGKERSDGSYIHRETGRKKKRKDLGKQNQEVKSRENKMSWPENYLIPDTERFRGPRPREGTLFRPYYDVEKLQWELPTEIDPRKFFELIPPGKNPNTMPPINLLFEFPDLRTRIERELPPVAVIYGKVAIPKKTRMFPSGQKQ